MITESPQGSQSGSLKHVFSVLPPGQGWSTPVPAVLQQGAEALNPNVRPRLHRRNNES